MSQTPLLYDWSGKAVSQAQAPITARPAQAISSPQGGAIILGSDYAATASAQVPKVDAAGNLFTVAQGWSQTNNAPTPFLLDPTGATVVRNALATTCTFAPTAQVNTGASAGKSMLSIYNGSSSLYFRVSALFMMCPPQAAVSGGLLGTSTTYTTVGMAVYRTTGAHTAGTVVAPGNHDTRTPTDASIVCRTGATVANQQAAALRVMDAAYSSTYPYLTRSDAGMQLATFGPGEGMNIAVLSAVGGSGVNFYVTAIIAQNTA